MLNSDLGDRLHSFTASKTRHWVSTLQLGRCHCIRPLSNGDVEGIVALVLHGKEHRFNSYQWENFRQP